MDIHFEGTITRRDFFQAHLLHSRPSPLFMYLRILAGAIFIAALIWIYMANPRNWQGMVLVAFPLLVATTPWWLPFFKSYSFNDPKNPLKDPIAGIAGYSGIVMSGEKFKSSMRWDSYTHHRASDDIVLLYQGKRGFNFFPRGLFKSEDEWQAFRRMVAERTSVTLKKQPRK